MLGIHFYVQVRAIRAREKDHSDMSMDQILLFPCSRFVYSINEKPRVNLQYYVAVAL